MPVFVFVYDKKMAVVGGTLVPTQYAELCYAVLVHTWIDFRMLLATSVAAPNATLSRNAN
jgi:hypothetical protein